jgi:ferredoxin
MIFISEACTACGACLLTCPTQALSPAPGRPRLDPGSCTDCFACLEVCPAQAISEVGPARTPLAGRRLRRGIRPSTATSAISAISGSPPQVAPW